MSILDLPANIPVDVKVKDLERGPIFQTAIVEVTLPKNTLLAKNISK